MIGKYEDLFIKNNITLFICPIWMIPMIEVSGHSFKQMW